MIAVTMYNSARTCWIADLVNKFGFHGSIVSMDACDEAGGTYYPVIFGWMVHVYPFEDTREKIWGQ